MLITNAVTRKWTVEEYLHLAEASIPDYWMVDLVNAQMIVHRDPGTPQGQEKAAYRGIEIFNPTDSVQPVKVPGDPCPLASFFG